MISAYNYGWVYNLAVIKEARKWWKHAFIDKEQFDVISTNYKTPLYHPNRIIRILLFIATLIALSGASGLFFLMFAEIGKNGIATACIFYAGISFFVLEKFFIGNNHYKSGVNEALLYHSCGFLIGGIDALVDLNTQGILWLCLMVFFIASIRYVDLLCTIASVFCFAGVLFFSFYELGGICQQIIPFIFMIFFGLIYWVVKRLQHKAALNLWRNNLLIVESASLLLIYLGGNYFVVRELSVAMLDMVIPDGQDIPFAFIFYFLTASIPLTYLYFGIKRKGIVLLRVSLIVIALSAFTFKYYFSLGHPEITLTSAGMVLLIVAITLLNYLKVNRKGFTRDNLLSEKWASMNVEAFVVSQTMGGNQGSTQPDRFEGGGGSFGGGGSTGNF